MILAPTLEHIALVSHLPPSSEGRLVVPFGGFGARWRGNGIESFVTEEEGLFWRSLLRLAVR